MNNQTIIKLLIVEDDETDFLLLSECINAVKLWQFDIHWVYNYADAIQELATDQYHICFSDFRLGTKNGIDLINKLQELDCETPVILLTGNGSYAIDKAAAKAGAYDYIVKDDLDEDKVDRIIRYTLERVANLRRIKENERKYRSIFERSKDIILIADTDTTILTINYAITDILAYQIEECKGTSFIIFFQDRELGKSFLEQLTEHGEVENFECTLIAKDHSLKICLLTASIETDASLRAYIQVIIHDISFLKKAEIASLQFEKMEASARFIRTLAHEVRNPLNNICLAAENLNDGALLADSLLYVEIIQRNTKRINDLIVELLQSSRIEEMNMQPESLHKIVVAVIKAVADRISLRAIQLNYATMPYDLLILADAEKLQMAILNIVINALEAVEDAVGIVNIKFQVQQNIVKLVIDDNGIGISEETYSRLFEPYFTSKRNGMGLGLITTLNILKSHKAFIEVSDNKPKGAAFTISFSLVEFH